MRVFLVLAVALMLSACGHGNADYSVSCHSVTCDGNDDRSDFSVGNDTSITCTWYCVDYEGCGGCYVSKTWWSWDGGCYELDDTYVSDGICD